MKKTNAYFQQILRKGDQNNTLKRLDNLIASGNQVIYSIN